MRILGLLCLIVLAGCSEAPSLQAYLILPSETPGDCALSRATDEARDADGWGRETNPGAIPPQYYEQPEGVDATRNIYATYDCSDGDVYAFAIDFPDTKQAEAFIDWRTPCASDEGMIQKGTIVARYDVDGDVKHKGLSSSMAARLGAEVIC